MTKTKSALPDLAEIAIALEDLEVHPLNARAASAETYAADDIAVLAASIATLGLLNPLIVQKTDAGWGVLAGGRRLAALRLLAADRDVKGWTARMKIACRALGDDVAAATAITVAENVTQKAMDPLDEFEAFARMMEVGGSTIEGIAATFGVETRRVAERLRYGRVHPDIRAAARAKAISLDVMKAFATHPDHGTQWAVYEATEGSYRQAWTIRDRLEKVGTKLGSPVGQLVGEAYRAADGPIAADLIAEDSVLADAALVERLLMEHLGAVAEAERARLGFAWAEGRRTADYAALRAFERTYPGEVEPEGAAAERTIAIADRLLAIDALRDEADEDTEDDERPDFDALEIEYAALQREHEELTTGYSSEQLAQAGVIAHWAHGGIEIVHGLIRPEDVAKASDEAPAGGGAAGGDAGSADGTPAAGEGATPLEVTGSLATDLLTERAVVIGAGLAADPALAQDLVLFKVAADLLHAHGTRVSWSMGVTASRGERPHAKPDGMDQGPAQAVAALRADLDLTWWDGARGIAARFEAFRLLDADMKARIVAVAMADAIAPSELSHGETLLTHVAHQVVPDLRAAWRPTGEAFFGRIRKVQLLHLLATDLGQPEEAARLGTAKKTEIVEYLDRLFAAPFATLTSEQREAVESWCPPGMAIPKPRERDRDTLRVRDDDPDAGCDPEADEEETFGPDAGFGPEEDPDETFDDDAESAADAVLAQEVPETENA